MTGAVIWFTGLPQSGKTTLARAVRARLIADGRTCVLLDGDELRPIFGVTGHDAASRDDFYGRLAGLAALLARQGAVVLVPATAPRSIHRAAARTAAPRYVEVHVATPLAVAEQRDTKGLYAAARAGDAPELPGVGVPYEPPLAPDVIATGGRDVAAIDRIVELAAP